MTKNRDVIDGYAVLHSIRLDGAEEIVAENIASANERYKLFRCTGDIP